MKLAAARRSAALFTLLLALAACDSAGSGTPSPGTSGPSVAGTPSGAAPSAATSIPDPGATSAGMSASPQPGVTATGAPSPAGAPRPSASPQGVQLVKSGGLAGVSETIEVKPDGSWRRSNAKGGASAGGRLTRDQMAQLQKLIADPALLTEGHRATAGPGRCADAFEYLLVVRYQLIHYTACGQTDKPEITLKIIELLQSATKGR